MMFAIGMIVIKVIGGFSQLSNCNLPLEYRVIHVMAGIAKLIKTIMMLAALVTSVETLVRIVRFAWAIILKLVGLFGRRSVVGQFRMKFTG